MHWAKNLDSVYSYWEETMVKISEKSEIVSYISWMTWHGITLSQEC